MIERKATGGSDTMNMGMKSELLAPSVQDTKEADLCTEVFGVARDFQKGFGTGAKQKIVDELVVLQDQWRQTTGQCEHDMGIARGEKFSATRSDPLFPSGDLTLGAMAVAAAIVGNGGTMSAAGALIDVTAEFSGATERNGQQHFDVPPTNPLAVALDKGRSRAADEIGHLERRPIHLPFLR
ncbi:MAG TPA: hypothetical protein VFJ47_16980 [Terriglobales bacterium]|nr:hypothetical protein [Terriglobales bacterium]